MKLHDNNRPFGCNTCGKSFITKYKLDVHEQVTFQPLWDNPRLKCFFYCRHTFWAGSTCATFAARNSDKRAPWFCTFDGTRRRGCTYAPSATSRTSSSTTCRDTFSPTRAPGTFCATPAVKTSKHLVICTTTGAKLTLGLMFRRERSLSGWVDGKVSFQWGIIDGLICIKFSYTSANTAQSSSKQQADCRPTKGSTLKSLGTNAALVGKSSTDPTCTSSIFFSTQATGPSPAPSAIKLLLPSQPTKYI